MADVTFTRSEYDEALSEWQLVEHVCAGERAVKSQGKHYLPQTGNPNADNAKEKYDRYLYRACFFGVTSRTLQSLIGAVFRKWPEYVGPAALEYVGRDVDGAGVSIYQQSQGVLTEVMKKGRHGLLVDYPKTERSASKADLALGLVRSSVISIDAKQIRNWRTTKVGGTHKLSLVVINESVTEVTEDGFGLEVIDQYRVLKLSDRKYLIEIWRLNKDGTAWEIFDEHFPLDGNGRAWDLIPFTFVGAKNNDSSIDDSPLAEMARLNLHHYHNSADFEHAAFFQGHPQPWMSGVDETHLKMMQENNLAVGADELMPVPSAEQFGIAQASSDLVIKSAMDQKYDYMVSVGARLIQKGEAVKTATEAQAENESEHSVLSLAASNVSEAYTQCLVWMASFMKIEGSEVVYTLNQELVTPSLDAQTLLAYNAIVDGGKMPKSDFWAILRRVGDIDPEKTNEDIKDEIEGQGDGLGLS